MPKVFVFELDGATWHVIDPLIRQGKLPNLAHLRAGGASGVLQSRKPMISPALWTTIYTGKTRDEHGVRAFDCSVRQVRCPRVWDIAHAHGLECGVFGSFGNWPPYDLGAFMVPDTMAKGSQTIPATLSFLQELAFGYLRGGSTARMRVSDYLELIPQMCEAGMTVRTLGRLGCEVIRGGLNQGRARDKYWRRALLLGRLSSDVYLKLCRTHRTSLTTYHYHSVDAISHRYWHYAHPAGLDVSSGEIHKYREVVPRAYEAADRVLGDLMHLVTADTTVMVLSDHGFCSLPAVGSRCVARLRCWMDVLEIREGVSPIRLGRQHFFYFDDISKMESVAGILKSAYVKESGVLVFSNVAEQDSAVRFTPALYLVDTDTTVVVPGHGEWPFAALFDDGGYVTSGVHHPEGIVLVAGPGVRAGVTIENATLLDVAPNMLALLGLPVARDMTGRLWREMLEESSNMMSLSLSYVDSYGNCQKDNPAGKEWGTGYACYNVTVP